MSLIRMVVTSLQDRKRAQNGRTRPVVRTAAQCEALEGRQLLNRGWGFPGGPGMMDAANGNTPTAHVRPWEGGKGLAAHQFGGKAGHHAPGAGLPGNGAVGPLANNPKAKADIQTLQTDMKALQAEVPAALQAQIKADKAIIDQALSSLTTTQRQAMHKTAPPPSSTSTTPPDPTAFLTTQLTAANVPAAQINQIVTDMQTYQNTLKTVDPTLSAKITADQQALANDLPANAHAGHPGGPGMMFGPGFPGM